jgi:hypothetical protein
VWPNQGAAGDPGPWMFSGFVVFSRSVPFTTSCAALGA